MPRKISEAAISYCGNLILDLRESRAGLLEMDGAAFESALGTTDRALGAYYQRIEECRRYVELHRPALCEPFSFGDAFRKWNPTTDGMFAGLRGKEALPVTGDSRQMLACLDLIARNARANTSRSFEIRVYAESKPPSLLILIDGEPPLGPVLAFGPGLDIDWEDLASRWAAASNGGLFYEDNLGLVLDLAGRETGAPGIPEFADAEHLLRRAERAMMPWRGAIGSTESGYAAPEEAVKLYTDHLERACTLLESASAAMAA